MALQSVMVRRNSETTARNRAPVFVLGCGRSGTTLFYHMLLSAGNFAVYRAESNAINLLEPRFGDLSVKRNTEKLVDAWLASKLYERSRLDAQAIRAKVIAECRNGGDFLRTIMSEMARQQNVERWADCTPEHLLYLKRIKETIPEALIIHIIRDSVIGPDNSALQSRAQGDSVRADSIILRHVSVARAPSSTVTLGGFPARISSKKERICSA